MEEIKTQLKYYSNLLDRMEKNNYLLSKKYYKYEILLLRISRYNYEVLN